MLSADAGFSGVGVRKERFRKAAEMRFFTRYVVSFN